MLHVIIPNERPGIITEMINAYLSDLGYSKEQLAAILNLTVANFEKIYLYTKMKMKSI